MKSILTFLLVALLLAFTPASFGSEVGYTVSETPAVSGVPLSTVTASHDSSWANGSLGAGNVSLYTICNANTCTSKYVFARAAHQRRQIRQHGSTHKRHTLHPRSTG